MAVKKTNFFQFRKARVSIACVEFYSSEENYNISLFEIIANPDLSLDIVYWILYNPSVYIILR